MTIPGVLGPFEAGLYTNNLLLSFNLRISPLQRENLQIGLRGTALSQELFFPTYGFPARVRTDGRISTLICKNFTKNYPS